MFCWSETLQLLQQPWGQEDHHDQEEGGRRMEPPDIQHRVNVLYLQLEVLLLSSEAASCGSSDIEASPEEQQQVQKLLQTTRTLRRDVCMAVSQMVG